jgi:ABC-2 type transport system permease protein
MKRFLILTKAQVLMQLRNRAVLFWNFTFPALLLVLYGIVFGAQKVGTVNYMTWVVPGTIVVNALSFGLVSSSTAMQEMREKGILRRLRATPLPALPLIGSYVLVNVVVGLIQAALILLVGAVLYQVPFTLVGIALAVPLIVCSTLTFIAIGQVINGLASKSGAVVAIGQIIYFFLMFTTDLILPLQLMPPWLQTAAPYLPSYAAAQLVRTPLIRGDLATDALYHLLILLAYAILATGVAAKLFRWDPKA